MLERLCDRIENASCHEFVDTDLIYKDKELSTWWTERLQQRQKRKQIVREQALAKLTYEEKVALGF